MNASETKSLKPWARLGIVFLASLIGTTIIDWREGGLISGNPSALFAFVLGGATFIGLEPLIVAGRIKGPKGAV
jgi:hypothetical protein